MVLKERLGGEQGMAGVKFELGRWGKGRQAGISAGVFLHKLHSDTSERETLGCETDLSAFNF